MLDLDTIEMQFGVNSVQFKRAEAILEFEQGFKQQLKRAPLLVDEFAFNVMLTYSKTLKELFGRSEECGGKPIFEPWTYNIIRDTELSSGETAGASSNIFCEDSNWHSHGDLGAFLSGGDQTFMKDHIKNAKSAQYFSYDETQQPLNIFALSDMFVCNPILNYTYMLVVDNFNKIEAHLYIEGEAETMQVPVKFVQINDKEVTRLKLAEELMDKVLIDGRLIREYEHVKSAYERNKRRWAGDVIRAPQPSGHNLNYALKIPFFTKEGEVVYHEALQPAAGESRELEERIRELTEGNAQLQIKFEQANEQHGQETQRKVGEVREEYKGELDEQRISYEGKISALESQAGGNEQLRIRVGQLQGHLAESNTQVEQLNERIQETLAASQTRNAELREQCEQETRRRVRNVRGEYEDRLATQRNNHEIRITDMNTAHAQELARLRRSPQITEPIVRAEVQNTYSSAEELAEGIEQKVSALRQPKYSNYLLNTRLRKNGQILQKAQINFSEFLNREYGKIKSVCSDSADFTLGYKNECSEWCGKQLENADKWKGIIRTDNPTGAAEIIERVSDIQATYIRLRNILSG